MYLNVWYTIHKDQNYLYYIQLIFFCIFPNILNTNKSPFGFLIYCLWGSELLVEISSFVFSDFELECSRMSDILFLRIRIACNEDRFDWLLSNIMNGVIILNRYLIYSLWGSELLMGSSSCVCLNLEFEFT